MVLTEEEIRKLIEEGRKLGLSEEEVRALIRVEESYESNLRYIRLYASLRRIARELGMHLRKIYTDIEDIRKLISKVLPAVPLTPEEIKECFVTETGYLHKPEKVWTRCIACGRIFPTFDYITIRYLAKWTGIPLEYFMLCPDDQKKVMNMLPLWGYIKGLLYRIPPEAQRAILKVLIDIKREWEEMKR